MNRDVTLADNDLGLTLPLDGLQLIEASAGTGKTYTLATLVLRLVIERGLGVEQILAVTFTEAATQELRERLRQRLQLAASIAAGDAAVLAQRGSNAEIDLTAHLIQRRLADETAASLQLRLQRAAHAMDLAAVYTIHGFCARVLGDHALASGRAFTAAEMIGSEQPLREEVAIDLWRALSVDGEQAGLLLLRWRDPAALARELGALLRATTLLLPVAPVPGHDPQPALQAASSALREAFHAHAVDAQGQLAAAMRNGRMNAGSYKPATIQALWDALRRWATRTDPRAFAHPKIELLSSACLLRRSNKQAGSPTPVSPLFDAVQRLLAAQAAVARYGDACEIRLLHRVCELARERMAALKRERHVQTYDDLIDDVATALDGPSGAALACALRGQYAVALVDEFQDTDARQWRIFQRVFADSSGHGDIAQDESIAKPALFVVGDPKQAIYRFRGGDVQTYLAAARAAGEHRHTLTRNFRSRPLLLEAIGALYAGAGEAAFLEDGIRFEPVAPGGRVADTDFMLDGRIAPALTIRMLPAPDGGQGAVWNAEQSRAHAARACVAQIHALLCAGRAGNACIDGRGVRPGDIAVLVSRHHDAARMQQALATAGIASVTAGKLGLFQTDAAEEVLRLLEALLQPGEDGRVRAALASVLLGQDAAAIARLGHDAACGQQWQTQLQAWRERWQRHGPLAMLGDVCAANAARLLGFADGERRLTDVLQLAELLQQAGTHTIGTQGLADWLQQQISEADADDETRQLRLESDAARVQIVTLHKSKGLEYPLVFLPFAALPRKPGNDRLLTYHRAGERITRVQALHAVADEPEWKEARSAAAREDEAEAMRLLYVGLTRAQHALWLAWGPLYAAGKSALGRLLGAAGATPQSLRAAAPADAIRLDEAPLSTARCAPIPAEPLPAPPQARIAQRALRRDWWVYSFSLLAHDPAMAGSPAHGASAATATAIELAGERGAGDEPDAAQPTGSTRDPSLAQDASATAAVLRMQPLDSDLRFSGVRFGNALHLALEQADFTRWRDWRGSVPPPYEEAALQAALRREGYADADLADGTRLLCELIANTLNVRLPEGAQLSTLPADARRAELEFHFAIAPVRVDALLALLHAHGLVLARQGFGLRRRIEGLMTGKIDLVYVHEGRFHVLDYKSNRLAGYGDAALAEAMRESEYDLQYLIYSLALHRWLRFRLGAAYDYDAHFGGVRYLFCRGLDAQRDGSSAADRPGIYASKPARVLIDALDALFAGDARSAA